MTTIAQGEVLALFAYDVGYEVDFDKLTKLSSPLTVPIISRKKQTPAYLQYSNPPKVLNLGHANGILESQGQIQATVFDFGAISIAYRWSLPDSLSLEDLPKLSVHLAGLNLEGHANQKIRELTASISPAIIRPQLSNLMEDYYVFIVEQLSTSPTADALINDYGSTISQILRFESSPLSVEQQEDALSQRISYYQNDLTIVDWNSAFIYDRDYRDIFHVLELLNVELLEARYIDHQLDRRVEEYTNLVQKRSEWPVPFRTPYYETIQDLVELRIETSLLAERVDNALKLIGDLYLARVHWVASKRFYLHEWEQNISRKLDIINSIYQFLTDRVRTAQSQTLELIIIILILFEILWALGTAGF
jgi:hypothetical protein